MNAKDTVQTLESLAVANEVLHVAHDLGLLLTPLQLQKLVYFSHGWCLGLYDRPLINEQVEAWPYGPVIPSIYHAFKEYGDDPIRARTRRYDPDRDIFVPWDIRESNDAELKSIADAIIRKVIDVYGTRSGVELSSITHARGTPWRAVFEELGGNVPKGTDIPAGEIKKYFKDISAD